MAEYMDSMGTLPVTPKVPGKLDAAEVPVPTGLQSEIVTLEVLLDIRDVVNELKEVQTDDSDKLDDILEKLNDIKELLSE